jgi:hypothetical protein
MNERGMALLEPTVIFEIRFKKGTKLADISRFINTRFPTKDLHNDQILYDALEREDIDVVNIPCPICGNPHATYGCYDAEVSGFCDKCNNYFNEINQCPLYIENPTTKDQCDECELRDPTICRMRVT